MRRTRKISREKVTNCFAAASSNEFLFRLSIGCEVGDLVGINSVSNGECYQGFLQGKFYLPSRSGCFELRRSVLYM